MQIFWKITRNNSCFLLKVLFKNEFLFGILNMIVGVLYMNKNKIIFIKFFLTTLLFIILPIFFLFSGAVYYNILKIKTNDINIEIKNELAEEINTLTEEEKN